nr:glycosyltransferase [uncultured Flavobacterium sp.]
MNYNPLVSVICLCYNHEKFVQEGLESIVNQTHKNIEIIIVDDCSTDNSVADIEKWLVNYPNVIFISNRVNQGNTKSFNTAFKRSTGSYIIDFATDDLLHPDCVATQLEQFKNSTYPNLGIVYGNAEMVFEDKTHFRYFFEVDQNKKRIQSQPTGDIYLGLLRLDNNVCSVSAMAKREVYEKLNGYNENLHYEDYDFWIRAARSYNFDYIDQILLQKRELKNSLSTYRFRRLNSKTQKYNRSTYKIVIHALKMNTTTEENKAVLNMIHHEMEIALRTIDPFLLLKYIILEAKVLSLIALKKRYQ